MAVNTAHMLHELNTQQIPLALDKNTVSVGGVGCFTARCCLVGVAVPVRSAGSRLTLNPVGGLHSPPQKCFVYATNYPI